MGEQGDGHHHHHQGLQHHLKHRHDAPGLIGGQVSRDSKGRGEGEHCGWYRETAEQKVQRDSRDAKSNKFHKIIVKLFYCEDSN